MANRAFVAVLEQNQLLMVRQTYPGQMFWTLPGGAIEPDERQTDRQSGQSADLAAGDQLASGRCSRDLSRSSRSQSETRLGCSVSS